MDDEDNNGIFNGSFFGGFFDKQFRDAMKDMDEMFKQLGDFHIEIRPPSFTVGNGKVPGYNESPSESPRDMMLKQDDTCNDKPCEQTPQGSGMPQPRMFHPGFRSPFQRGDQGNMEFTPGSNNNFRFQMSSHSTSIKHNPDGSMEKIVKTIENGQKCTTITKTDKSGNTTTTSTCDDRPGDIPSIRDKPPSPFSPRPAPVMPRRTGGTEGLNDQDKTIYDRYFKDWFSPKDK